MQRCSTTNYAAQRLAAVAQPTETKKIDFQSAQHLHLSPYGLMKKKYSFWSCPSSLDSSRWPTLIRSAVAVERLITNTSLVPLLTCLSWPRDAALANPWRLLLPDVAPCVTCGVPHDSRRLMKAAAYTGRLSEMRRCTVRDFETHSRKKSFRKEIKALHFLTSLNIASGKSKNFRNRRKNRVRQ